MLGRKIDSRTVLFLTKRADPKDKAQERIVAVLLYRLKSSEALSVDCKPSSGFGSVVGVVQDTVGGLYMSVRAAWKVDFEHEQIRSIPPISVKCMPNGSGD